MLNLFVSKVTDEWGTSFSLKPAGYVALVILMVLLLLSTQFFNRDKETKQVKAKPLAFSAMAVALAMVTSYLKLWDMPMGGSVTLFSMLFICLVGNWYGLKTGIMTGMAYGLLQLIVDPYIISLPQMLIDYIFAFGALGLSGIFTNSKQGLLKGYIAGILGRFVFSVLSGLIFFASYAEGTGMSALGYSVSYNGAYLGAEAILTIIVILLPPVSNALAQVKKSI